MKHSHFSCCAKSQHNYVMQTANYNVIIFYYIYIIWLISSHNELELLYLFYV